MAGKIDWEVVRFYKESGLTLVQIAKKLKVSVGTLRNNKKKYTDDVPTQASSSATGEIGMSPIVAKELDVEQQQKNIKDFYIKQMGKIRGKIDLLLNSEIDEETFREVQLLEKLLTAINKAMDMDYRLYDIMSYRDVVALENTLNRFELEILKYKKQ